MYRNKVSDWESYRLRGVLDLYIIELSFLTNINMFFFLKLPLHRHMAVQLVVLLHNITYVNKVD